MRIEIEAKRKFKNKQSDQKSLYNWIMHHPQVVESPTFNGCVKVKINGHTRPHFLNFFRCPYESFITALLVTQKMVDSKKQ